MIRTPKTHLILVAQSVAKIKNIILRAEVFPQMSPKGGSKSQKMEKNGGKMEVKCETVPTVPTSKMRMIRDQGYKEMKSNKRKQDERYFKLHKK